MLRRTSSFFLAIALIAAVACLVYFNSKPTTFTLAPGYEYTMPLAWLIVGSVCCGALLVFIVLLAREGRWALRQWRIQRARRAAERATALKAEARGLVLAGQCGKARVLLAQALKHGGAVAGDVVDHAETYIAEGRFEDARRVLEEGLADFGSDPLLLHGLARCCRALGDNAAAASALERAVVSFPASVVLYRMLRDALVATSSWKRAEEVQQRLVDLLPNDGGERERLVEIRMHAIEHSEGADRETGLRAVVALNPDFAPAVVERAEILASQGRRRAALRLLLKSAKRRPTAVVLAALERLLEPTDSARLLKIYAKLRARFPRDAELALQYARLMIRMGRDDEAERALEVIDDPGRDGILADSLRALVQEHRSQPGQAAETLRSALDKALATKPA
ncbi:MAG: DUF1049 domain-containing protein [Deltaproteobacteria bacterium]|nr:DUF1049 domain-containing protein [Deltaproteobacteria bacterium]